LQRHLKNILSPSQEKKMEYAKKKLEAAGQARDDLIEKNTPTFGKKAHSDPLKTADAKDDLSVLSKVVDKASQESLETKQQTINEYLSQQAEFRKDNQLVYGKSLSNSSLIGLGVGLAENPSQPDSVFYKKKLTSTLTYTYRNDDYAIQGTAQFGITHDNKIFIVPKCDDSITSNLYKMAQGTLLKAVGCIQISAQKHEESVEEGDTDSELLKGQVKYISVYNSFFDVPKDNIALSLFVLKNLGIDLSATQVVVPDDKAPLINGNSGCNIRIHGNLKDAAYYLNESRFSRAKALAEKNLRTRLHAILSV
jgi:hypothetical protein